ncbi:glycerol kinase GlpK [Paralysiella testudinis]|uniref:Glycerol kinase n=1 Tax=Paralysiella testudinis TaxID=2809020 RepID=A0A892ZEY7_9NEIS|nr:glycerol kinase GlpK [Paralysiella testudinis]QRQ81058.1 glycerol kinase GlpK [Paralysiella testudinis]
MGCLLALDQGTTSSRAIVFDAQGQVLAMAQKPFALATPQPGWVTQDAWAIWNTQIGTAQEAISQAGLLAGDIAAIGLANQRETTVLWDKASGKPLAPALVWQDRRTAPWCQALREAGHEARIQHITGLKLDPYFSAGKLAWLLQHTPQARELASQGRLAFGTIDSWLIFQLTRGLHVTDISNAARTMLMDIHSGQWSAELLDLFDIPAAILPKIVPSGSLIGHTAAGLLGAQLPLFAAMGDQQAALFGHGCVHAGMAKNTYGTGCFMLMNTGSEVIHSQHQLLSTVAWQQSGQPTQYALEGSVFMAGAIVQWLRDNLDFVRHSHEIEALAQQADSSEGVVLVPAFTGLGAPYWQADARASLSGLTRGTGKAHIARAALEAIAFQVADVLNAMQQDAPTPLTELRVDGGASANNMLMQFQADILGVPVLRPTLTEITAFGAVKMAGLACGLFNPSDVADMWQLERRFDSQISADERQARLQQWQAAVRQVLSAHGNSSASS